MRRACRARLQSAMKRQYMAPRAPCWTAIQRPPAAPSACRAHSWLASAKRSMSSSMGSTPAEAPSPTTRAICSRHQVTVLGCRLAATSMAVHRSASTAFAAPPLSSHAASASASAAGSHTRLIIDSKSTFPSPLEAVVVASRSRAACIASRIARPVASSPLPTNLESSLSARMARQHASSSSSPPPVSSPQSRSTLAPSSGSSGGVSSGAEL
mmetsp:Transcript_7907/g.18057  ORF Transcript_7907/g.18057 Transcript_7907/m.18057 type:complete len:212 (-) Transcript_7907:668-1303(-)